MIDLKDAIRGAPEAAFWPAVASIISYTNSPSASGLLIMFILSFTGAMTYVTMRRVKSVFEEIQETSIPRPRRRGNRHSSNNAGTLEILEEVYDTVFLLMPGPLWVRFFIAFCILVDVLGLLGYSHKFLSKIIFESATSEIFVFFAALPIVYVFVIVSVFIWKL